MKKIILISHGNVSAAFDKTMEDFFMSNHIVESITLLEGEDMMGLKNKIDNLKLTKTDEHLVFVDIFGGTPFNVASVYFRDYPNTNVIYGLNLPMLFSACSTQEWNIDQIIADGQNAIGVKNDN